MHNAENILKALGKEKSCEDKDMQLFYLWKSYLSTSNLKTAAKKL